MTQEMKSRFARWRSRGLAAQAAVLTVAVLAVYAVVAPVAAAISGLVGLAAAAVAAGLCLVGAGLALVASRRFRDPKNSLQGVLIGMLLRMGVPLFSALAIQVQGGSLAKAGVLIYLVVFYPVTLFVETALSLPSDDRARRQRGVSEKVVL
jgi:hypothetical protein